MLSPFTRSSPVSSSIFASTPGIVFPTEPSLVASSVFKDTTGDASDSPYPSYILMPIVWRNFAISISRGAPPDKQPLNFPPKFLCIDGNNFFRNFMEGITSAILYIILNIIFLKNPP